ncbi:DUF3168 domain-containing protein [Brucella sp. H1_1004]|uniref:DUF3168 domain-containing protein n=1 Tax=Brucella sp. H1_1004 TaxID=3110109 RepID=UPI0039B5E75C
MSSASLELQGAIVLHLLATPALTSLVGENIFDMAPPEAIPPYVVMGDFDEHRADVTCVGSRVIYATLHAWSNYGGGFAEVKKVAEAVADALHDAPLQLPTNRLVSLHNRQTRTFRDLDGIHSHAVIELTAYVDKI